MKKRQGLMFFLVLIGLILINTVKAEENLYRCNSLELKLDVKGGLELTAEGAGAKVDSVKAELWLYPADDFRQTLLELSSDGEVEENKVIFEWKDKKLGKKEFGFEARIKTEDKRIDVDKKILFPLLSVKGYEDYVETTEYIDMEEQTIVEKAAELVEGEEDLFKAVFKLAKWVEENIEYKLNTLTAGVSQKASWVLEHRQGVCDEMTSLFIAMCRTLGIPARFVSGIGYTTSELFKEHWLPHGWAEVYFPDYGWVSFDMAFGEFGYVDVAHIKLKEGFDPGEASTKFEWVGKKVRLKSEELNFLVEIKGKEFLHEEEISLEEEVLSKEVGIGGYNLIKGIVENKKNYYTATTLSLTTPKEVEIVGERTKIILLEPKERKEVFWPVKVNEDLPKTYRYEFPAIIYSEKNISAEGKFEAVEGGIFYSKEEAESLMPKEEEKKLAGKVSFNCNYEEKIRLGESKEIVCVIKNKGNVNLKKIGFCLGETCKIIDLLINQEEKLKIKVKGEAAGWQKLIVSAENEEIEKKISLEYVILDDPKAVLKTKLPEEVNYGENFTISLKINKNSFSTPEKVTVILEGAAGFESKWEMEELKEEQEFLMELNSKSLGKENRFRIKLQWEDKFGEKFGEEKTISVKVEGKTFWERVIMWYNSVIIFFMKY